jgi:N-acyl homoserine lactone hydrolase
VKFTVFWSLPCGPGARRSLFTGLLTASLTAAPAADAEPPPPDAAKSPALAEWRTEGGLRIVAMRTGWVGVKSQHRELSVPRWMAIPSITLGWNWADWMPIVSYAIVHPEGAVLVDTGPSPRINEPDYFACDKRDEFLYRRNLRFAVPPGDTLAPRLAQAGIDPAAVTTLVVTHFHGDPVGGIDVVPAAKLYTGAGNWPTHVGAFTCHIPATRATRAPVYEDQPVAGIARSMSLTRDGRVRIMPLPGHAPGHVGVAVIDGGRTWLMVGDATFDLDQTRRGGITGVSQHFDEAIATQALLRQAADRPDVIVLPAHDPIAFERITPKPPGDTALRAGQ